MFLLLPFHATAQQTPAQTFNPGSLHALLAEHLEWRLREFPESATRRGDGRYNARLTDLSAEAIERRKQATRRFLARARAIDPATLSRQDVLTHALFVSTLERDVEGDRFPSEVLPVDQINGPQLAFDNLIEVTRFRTRADYDDYLARLAAVPRYFDQVTALLRRGIDIGTFLRTDPRFYYTKAQDPPKGSRSVAHARSRIGERVAR